MKFFALLAALGGLALAQGVPPAANEGALSQTEAQTLATRMLQLMESTAAAAPGLTRASEPIRQNAEAAFTGMQAKPLNASLTYQLLSDVRAYLALTDAMPRQYPFPAAADQQAAELRDSLLRMQRHFEAILQVRNQAEQKKDADPDNLKRYAEANTKLPPPTKMPRVVFLGDSITEAWRLNEYFTGRDFINRGIGGQTTLQMLARFRQDVESLNPKVVVVLGGTNDIEAGISAAQIEENLATMGELAKARGIRVVFGSITPVSDYHKDVDPGYAMTPNRPPATIQAINKWLQGLCLTQGYVYLDYYSVMVDSSGQMQAELADDGLHPNSKGYRVMSPRLLEAVERAAQDTPEESKRRFRLLSK